MAQKITVGCLVALVLVAVLDNVLPGFRELPQRNGLVSACLFLPILFMVRDKLRQSRRR